MLAIATVFTSVMYKPQPTADGSVTFYSDTFGESFHSRYGANQEAESKFVAPTQIARKATGKTLSLLDICYGLGYNSAVALDTIWTVNPECQVEWVGLELDRAVCEAAIEYNIFESRSSRVREIVSEIATGRPVNCDRFSGKLLLGDARETIATVLNSGFRAEAIFLDPFSPQRCPQLWTVEFLQQVANILTPSGRLATYSCAAAVRSALQLVGLNIGTIAPVGRRWPGTVASFSSIDLPPLTEKERQHLQTRAAIPYRDRTLRDDATTIIKRRAEEVETSTLESTTQWKRRWPN